MWGIVVLMGDLQEEYEEYRKMGDPPPSEAEPQDARFEAPPEDALTDEERDTLLMHWLLAMTPEQRLRSHDGTLEWFYAVRSGRIKLYGAMDITAPPMTIASEENSNTGI